VLAGFLNGRKAATHWDYHDSFQENFPEVNLVRDIFVEDEKYTTALSGHGQCRSQAALD
jgi:transcriptional regulator GlxA family with amidase domain